MTGYTDKDTSSESQVVYYHEFNTQLGFYRYNTSSSIRTLNGFTWMPLAVKHSQVKQTPDISKGSLLVELPLSSGNTLSSDFNNIFPRGTYTMFRGFLSGTGETLVNFKGKMFSKKTNKHNVEIKIESILSSQNKYVLSDRANINCRYSVYGRGCNLDKTYFETEATLQDITGKTVTVYEAAYESDGWFNGGFIEMPDGDLVMIVSHETDQLELSSVPDYVSINGIGSNGIQVSISPGCDKTKETCLSKFNNLPNNGGFKYFGTRNPFAGGSII